MNDHVFLNYKQTWKKLSGDNKTRPRITLQQRIKSARSRRSSRRSSPSKAKRSSYGNVWYPGSRLVKRRCTDSSWFMSVTATGDHTGLQYSSIGRTYVVKALHKILASLHKNSAKSVLISGVHEKQSNLYDHERSDDCRWAHLSLEHYGM